MTPRHSALPRFARSLALASLLVASGGCILGCSAFKKGPTGDPVRMSEAELDLAADLWWRQNQPREALKHALQAVEYDDRNSDAAHLVSLIYLNFCQVSRIDECRLDEAERFARKAIKTKKDNLEAKNTLAVVLIHQKRFDDALEILLPITEDILYPTPEIAWGNAGWAYLEKGDLDAAIPALRRAVAAQPLFCVGNYRLGLAFQQSGDLDAALEALDRALETDAPGCAALQDAFLERARVHLALGDIELTRADLDRCIALDKHNDAGRECNELLTSLQ